MKFPASMKLPAMKKILLLTLFFTQILMFAQPVDLFQQFNGRLDFTAFGNTLNEFPNNGGNGNCTLLLSSSATLNLSAGQTFVSAHLYWGSVGAGDFDVDLNGNAITADRIFAHTFNGLPYFAAYKDVTSIVAAAGNGNYTFSELDVTSVIGNYCGTDFGGWGIYVIYSDPSLRLNQISLFDGLESVSANNNTLAITLTNIDVTSDILSKIGFLAWEGEESIANNETLLINGTLIDNPPLNPGDNAFNGTNSYTGSDVNYNMDLDFYDLAGIVMPGDTSVLINLTSSQDFVMVNNIITSVNSELSDASIEIDDVGVLCENDNMTIDYTVYNVNSTAPLALNTPIAVYANAVLIGQTQTVADIPIGGSESGSIVVTIPMATPNIFDLRVVVDDVGNGTGVVDETDETNNEDLEVIDLSMAGILLDPGPACLGSAVVLDSGVTDPPFNIQWFESGTPIPGATNSTLNVIVNGIYSVEAIDGICRVTSNPVVVSFNPQPVIAGPPVDLFQCDDGTTAGVFDLTVNDAPILGGQDPTMFEIFYYETLLDSQNDTNRILGPTVHLIVPPSPQRIYVRIQDLTGSCFALEDFDIYFSRAIAGIVPLTFNVCDFDSDGGEFVDLFTEFNSFVLDGEPSSSYDITYHSSQADADGDVGALPNPYFVNAPNEIVFIRLENRDDASCFDTTRNVDIIIDTLPVINDMPPTLILCDPNNDGFAEFDLSVQTNVITLGDPALGVTYHGTLIDAQSGVLPLPLLYINDDIYLDAPVTDITDPLYGTGGVWARVESSVSTCFEVVSFALEVRFAPVATTPADPLRQCDDGVADGFTFFDLTVVEPEVLGSMDPTQFDIYYYEDQMDAITAGDLALTAPDFTAAIPTPMAFLNSTNPQIIYILVVGNATSTIPPNPNSGEGCYDIVELELIVDPVPVDLGPFEMMLCDDELNGSTLDDEISTFDLTTQNVLVNGGDPTIIVLWFATVADEIADIPIVDPTMFQNSATPQTIVGRATSAFGCSNTVTLTLTVLPNPNPKTDPTPLELCDDDDDGLVAGFDLTLRDIEIIDGELDVSVLYYEDLAVAEAGVAGTEIAALYTNIVPFSQIVYARVTKDVPPATLACYTIVELELVVIALPDMPDSTLFDDPFLSCDESGSGTAIFDLTLQDPGVLGVQNAADFVPITYYELEADAQAGIAGTEIAPANSFISGGQPIWVRLESLITGCVRVTEFQIEVGIFPTAGVGNDLFACDDEIGGSTLDDGLSTFDLTVNTVLINLGDFTLDVVYYATLADQAANIPIATPGAYQNVIIPQQQIFVSAFSDQDCAATSTFYITVEPLPITGDPGTLIACDSNNDGFTEFDLNTATDAITLLDPALSVTYHGTFLDANNGVLPLPNPYTNEDIYNDVPITDITDPLYGTGGVWARVETTANTCHRVVPFALEVHAAPIAVTPEPLRVCDDAVADGITEFDLTVVEPEVLDTLDPTQFDIYYYVDNADAVIAGDLALTAPDFSAAIPNPTNYTNLTNPQDVYVLVVGNATSTIPPNPNGAEGCYDIVVLQLIVDPIPMDLGPFEMMLCDDDLQGSTLDDEISTFDLTSQDVSVNGGDPTITVTWFATLADEMADIPIVDPTMFQNSATPQTVIGRPTSAFGCSNIVTLTLTVLPNPNPNLTPDPLELCDDDDDGIVGGFDLSLRDVEIIDGEPDVSILYYELLADAEAGTLGAEIPVGPYTNINPFSQIVYARVTKDVPPSALACYTIVELELIVVALPDMPDATFQDPFLGCDLDGTGQAIFDLTLQDPSVLGSQVAADFEPVSYYTNQLDAEAGVNAISPANAFPSTGQTIWVRLESLVTGCVRITQFEIAVIPFPTIAVGNDLSLCDDEIGGSTDDDGLSTFDLTINTPVITLGNGTLTVVYYATAADQISDSPIMTPDAYQNISTPSQEIFVSIFSGEGCVTTSSFFINVDPNPIAVVPTALIACDDDNNGFAPFALSDKDAEIVAGATDVALFGYFLTEVEAQAGDLANILSDPYTNIVANNQTVWARIQNTITTCYDVVPLELIVIPSPDAPVVPGFGDLTSCDGMGGGDAEFNLEDNTAFVYGTQDPLDFTISYHTDAIEAEDGINPIANTTNFVSSGQTIWVRLLNNATDCYRVTAFELIVGVFPLIADPTSGVQACDDPSGGSSSDGIAEFDLTLNDAFITIGDPNLSVFYYESQADQNAGLFIDPATAYQNMINPMTVYVSVFNGTGCSAQTTITLSVNPNPEPVTPTPLIGCDTNNDGFTEFNLTDKDAEITGGQPDVTISYYETLSDAENAVFALLSPYVNIMADNQVVYARASFPVIPTGTGCYGIVELELIVSPTPLVPTDLPDLVLCDDDGFGIFDLTEQDVVIYGSQDPADFTLSYHVSMADADGGLNAIPNPTTYTNILTPEQTIYVRLLDPLSGCFKTGEFLLKASIGPVVSIPDPLSVCDDLGEPNDGITAFDLTIKNDEITGGATGVGVRYYETQADADNDTNRIDPETAYVNTSNPQDIYVRVVDGNTECDDTSVSLRLRVVPNPTPITPDPIELCDDIDPGDELEVFDLTIREGQMSNGQNWEFLYYEDQALAIEGDPLLAIIDPTMYTNTGNPQTIYVRVSVPVTMSIPDGCFEIVELIIMVNPLPDDTAVVEPYNICEVNSNGDAVFDLTSKNIEILGVQDPLLFDVSFYTSDLDAMLGTNPIVNASTYQNVSNPETIYTGITDIATGCYIGGVQFFDIEVLEGATATTPALPYAICDSTDPNDGFSEFDLSATNTTLYTEILGAQATPPYELSFYETLAGAETGDMPLPGAYTNIINPQVVYGRVTNSDTDCYAIVELILKVEQLPVVTLEEEYRLCVDANGNPIPEEEGAMSPPVLEVNLDPSLYNIVWDTPSGTVFGTSVTALEGGTYTVNYTEIGSILGCSASASTTVTVSQPPVTYEAVLLNGAFADSHTIQATAEGMGTYVFQLDDGPFIEGGTFENVSAGIHVVTIKDENGCGSVTLEVGVIDYPRYVTPNQDGYHDTWNIIGIAAFDPSAKIYIFDRFGKLLKQVSPLGTGWNGTYNGNPLPSSDYWFVVEYQEEGIQKEFKGHFTLKR